MPKRSRPLRALIIPCVIFSQSVNGFQNSPSRCLNGKNNLLCSSQIKRRRGSPLFMGPEALHPTTELLSLKDIGIDFSLPFSEMGRQLSDELGIALPTVGATNVPEEARDWSWVH